MKRFSDWRKDPFNKITDTIQGWGHNDSNYVAFNNIMAKSAGGQKNKWSKIDIALPPWYASKFGPSAYEYALNYLAKKGIIEISPKKPILGGKVRLTPKYYEWDIARTRVGPAASEPGFTKGT